MALHGVASEGLQPLASVAFEAEPQQGCKKRVQAVCPLSENRSEAHLQLEPHARLRIADADLQKTPQELPEGVVRHVLRVGNALCPQEPHVVLPTGPSLTGQPALANPGLTGDRDDRAAAFDEISEHLVEHGELLRLALAGDPERLNRVGLPPEALDLPGEQEDDLVEEELRPLGAELLGDRRRAGDVGQQDGDDASLAGWCGHRPIIRVQPSRR